MEGDDDDLTRNLFVPLLLAIYGGTFAFVCAGFVNARSVDAVGLFWAVVLAGPATEELLKAFGVVLATMLIRSPGDGGRFGLSAGLGFALAEAFANATAEGPASFLMRLLATPMHAGATAMTGFAYGLAVRDGRPWALPLGYLSAVLLHSSFNLFGWHEVWFGGFLIVLLGAGIIGATLTADHAGPRDLGRPRRPRPRWR